MNLKRVRRIDWRSALAERDLVAVAAAALAGLFVTVVPFPDEIRTVVLLPLVLFLPGYALAAALFPPRFVTRDERAVFVVAFSIGAAALGGLALQLFAPLGRASWLALLLVVTLAACAVALVRRVGMPARPAPAGSMVRRPKPVAAFAAILATLIAAAALAIASGGAERELEDSRFAAIWIVSRQAGSRPTERVLRIGVENHRPTSAKYLVRVSRNDRPIVRWRIRLDEGEIWSRRIPVTAGSGNGPVVAALLLHGKLYRRVSFEPKVTR